jgi:Yip1-like protein
MEPQSVEPVSPPAPADAEPSLSIVQRAVAIFTRPTAAWSGLRTRSQWWFPLIIMTLMNVAFSATLWERAILPMQLDRMEEQVADGKMDAAALDRAETMMRSPAGLAFAVLPWVVLSPLFSVVAALILMVAVGFMLGGKLPFRHAFEVSTWSGLIQIPSIIVTGILAWSKQTMEGVHVSLAALLPEPDKTDRVMRSVIGVLDGLGPFGIWWIAVVIIGASVLSGVPRKRVAWSVGGIYVGLLVFFVVLGGMLRRAG